MLYPACCPAGLAFSKETSHKTTESPEKHLPPECRVIRWVTEQSSPDAMNCLHDALGDGHHIGRVPKAGKTVHVLLANPGMLRAGLSGESCVFTHLSATFLPINVALSEGPRKGVDRWVCDGRVPGTMSVYMAGEVRKPLSGVERGFRQHSNDPYKRSQSRACSVRAGVCVHAADAKMVNASNQFGYLFDFTI